MERGELDVIATREITRDRVASRRILPMHVLAVMRKGHLLAAGRAVKVDDLLAENLMLGLPSFTSRMLFDAARIGFDTRPRIVLESLQQRALVALAEVGHGVAIVPSVVSLAGHAVAARPIRSGGQPMGIGSGLVWDRRRSIGAVMSFVDIANRVLQKGHPRRGLFRLRGRRAGRGPLCSGCGQSEVARKLAAIGQERPVESSGLVELGWAANGALRPFVQARIALRGKAVGGPSRRLKISP